MEQHKPASPQSAAPQTASPQALTPQQPTSPPPPSPLPDDNDRCAYVSRRGRRCRASSAAPLLRLCRKHSAQTAPDPDSGDLSANLFGGGAPTFGSIEEINSVLTNLVVLVAQGRISSRRAGVIVYALSFILRGLQLIDKKTAEAPQEFVIDIDSAVARRAQALQTQATAHDPFFSGNR